MNNWKILWCKSNTWFRRRDLLELKLTVFWMAWISSFVKWHRHAHYLGQNMKKEPATKLACTKNRHELVSVRNSYVDITEKYLTWLKVWIYVQLNLYPCSACAMAMWLTMTFKASIASEVRKVQVRYLAIRGTAAPLTEEKNGTVTDLRFELKKFTYCS